MSIINLLIFKALLFIMPNPVGKNNVFELPYTFWFMAFESD